MLQILSFQLLKNQDLGKFELSPSEFRILGRLRQPQKTELCRLYLLLLLLESLESNGHFDMLPFLSFQLRYVN